MPHFTNALSHASDFWFRPCADGVVYCKSAGQIHIASEFASLKLDRSKYTAVFLNYDRSWQKGPAIAEGLYIIPNSSFSIGRLCSYNAQLTVDIVTDFPERYFICAWPDSGPERDANPGWGGMNPRHFGLNDCVRRAGTRGERSSSRCDRVYDSKSVAYDHCCFCWGRGQLQAENETPKIPFVEVIAALSLLPVCLSNALGQAAYEIIERLLGISFD
jgi:hypothetical protein